MKATEGSDNERDAESINVKAESDYLGFNLQQTTKETENSLHKEPISLDKDEDTIIKKPPI